MTYFEPIIIYRNPADLFIFRLLKEIFIFLQKMANKQDAPTKAPCLKCKYLIDSGLTCINCGSMCHPSCSQYLRHLEVLSATTTKCCKKSECNTPNSVLIPDNSDLSQYESLTEIIRDVVTAAVAPLVDEISHLREEILGLKRSISNNQRDTLSVQNLQLQKAPSNRKRKCMIRTSIIKNHKNYPRLMNPT